MSYYQSKCGSFSKSKEQMKWWFERSIHPKVEGDKAGAKDHLSLIGEFLSCLSVQNEKKNVPYVKWKLTWDIHRNLPAFLFSWLSGLYF